MLLAAALFRRLSTRSVLPWLCLGLLLLALPAQSYADANHPLLDVITGELSSEGERTPDSGIEGACGVAVDSNADVYVSDYYHDATDVFYPRPTTAGRPTVEYLTQVAKVSSANGPCGLAVDASGDLFVNDWHHQVIEFRPTSFPPTASTKYEDYGLIDPGPANGVKFDPLSGHVYVDDGTHVAEYEPSGAPVLAGGQAVKIGLGTLYAGFGLAVSDYPATAGDVYVADAADNTVHVYDPEASLIEPIETVDGAGTPEAGFTHLGESELAVDPTDGHLFVLDQIGHHLSERPAIVVDEFDDSGDFRSQIVAPPPWVTKPNACVNPDPATCLRVVHRFTDAEPSGLAVGPYQELSDALFVSAGNSEAAAVWIFGQTAPAHRFALVKTGTGGGTVTSEPAGINCGTACAAEYEGESAVTLNAVPDPHSDFRGWSVSGPNAEPCPGTGSCTVNVFGNVEVTAEFEAAPQNTLSVSITGAGTVVSRPSSIACPGKCSEEFAEDHTIILSARPELHNRVVGWSGCSYQPDAGECAVAMSETRSVGVEFVPIPPDQLTISVSGPGRVTSYPAGISCPFVCGGTFDEESTVFLIPSPDPGFRFGGWQGASCKASSLCAVGMEGAESVAARFVGELPADEEAPALPSRTLASLPEPMIHLREFTLRGAPALAATVSGAGRLSILSPWLRPVGVEVGALGTVRIPLPLGGSGRAALMRRKRHRLRVAVTVLFMPSYRGTPAFATKAVTFEEKGAPHEGQHRGRP